MTESCHIANSVLHPPTCRRPGGLHVGIFYVVGHRHLDISKVLMSHVSCRPKFEFEKKSLEKRAKFSF
jgi:hypothetical protein